MSCGSRNAVSTARFSILDSRFSVAAPVLLLTSRRLVSVAIVDVVAIVVVAVTTSLHFNCNYTSK